MSALYSHLKNRNPTGIPSDDAVQLFLWIYCTLEILPESLKVEKIGEHELIEAFSALTSDGLIITGDRKPEWKDLKSALLTKAISLDKEFRNRASLYLGGS